MSGSPAAISPLPQIVVGNDVYAQFAAPRAPRRARRASRPNIHEHVQPRARSTQYNTVAEIRGSGEARRSRAPRRAPRLVGSRDRRHRQRHRRDRRARGRAHSQGRRREAEAHDSLRAVHAARRKACTDHRPTPTRTSGSSTSSRRCSSSTTAPGRITGMALQGREELRDMWKSMMQPRDGARPARREVGQQDRHRSPVVPAVRRAGVQLRPAHARLRLDAPLAGRRLRA